MPGDATPAAARIYNLHPLLAGPIAAWPDHLPRIRAMGFDWIYVNAFFKPGASDSIYAVADVYELHPSVRGSDDRPAAELIQEFAAQAANHDLRLMTDLVLPHAAIDGRLVEERPDWFKRRADGTLISPQLANPSDPFHPQMMADLAEIVFTADHRSSQLQYFSDLAAHFIKAGFQGLRCSTAYKVPGRVWGELIAAIRARHSATTFVAAALGCPIEQMQSLEGCGFDYVFDSSFWWNFHDRWFLEQLPIVKRIGATISFPEYHNTPRLAQLHGLSEPAAIERLYRGRYLASIGIGSGILMPMGFEFGLEQPLGLTPQTSPNWEDERRNARVDLRDFIAGANRLKDQVPVLRRNGALQRVTAPNAPLVGLMRADCPALAHAKEVAILTVNPQGTRAAGSDIHGIFTATGGRFESFADRTPADRQKSFIAGHPLTLEPLETRIFHGVATPPRARRPLSAKAGEKRLHDLAATRVAIEKVTPEIDGGRFPVKRITGEVLTVEADIFADGHDKIAARLKYRAADQRDWSSAPMAFVDNDRWAGSFPLTRNSRYQYTIEAWRDVFASWCYEVGKKHDAGLDLALELEEGRQLVALTAEAAEGADRSALTELLADLRNREADHGYQLARFLSDETRDLMERTDLRDSLSRYDKILEVTVDRTIAAYAAWYEIFPRSHSDDPERHGTWDDVIRKLPYVEAMGFDVLYFPPIHPIGKSNRKGRNNSLTATVDDPGSPYAIGSEEGGHKSLHKELGTFVDFKRLVDAAADHGLEIAIDFAIQCSPDHPWLKSNPEWFDWRPDGSLKYAENPPKKYEDITNVSFYREGAFPALWYELRDTVLFWVEHGVKIFRVDNPHTKPLPFWEWLFLEVQDRHPDTIFLAEAFTRPKMMKRLAKVGFTQSYSYFTWRNTKQELQEYLIELTKDEPREHMRPNFFVNTPDINPVYLQTSGRAGFQIRVVLAATLSPVYGVYSGYELAEATPVPGKEEYLNSEKYEIRAWDWDRPSNIRADVTRLNMIRRDNPALWQFANLEFHEALNDHIMVYSKYTDALDNLVVVALNLDPHNAQGAQFEIPLWRFGLDDHASIEVEDLLTGSRFTWTGKSQHVWLNPGQQPYLIWRLVPPGLPT